MGLHGRTLPYALVALFALGNGAARGADWPAAGERRTSFDARWRFQKGDAAGAEKAEFDDARWRVLDLPHDWAIEGPFDPAISPHQGALPYFGVAWYRKRFEVQAGLQGQRAWLIHVRMQLLHSQRVIGLLSSRLAST